MAVELKLGSIYTEDVDKKTYVKLGSVLFNVDSGEDKIVLSKGAKVEKGSSASFNMGTVGVLKIDAEGKLTLQAGSDVTGVVTITDNSDTAPAALEKLEKITFSKTVEFDVDNTTLKSVTGSSYADKFIVTSAATDFVLNAGSGDDEITISGSDTVVVGTIDANSGNDKITLNITGGNELKGELKLGSGKDTLVATAGKAAIADYNFKEDVIQMADTVTLDKKGVLSNGSASITGAMNVDDVYYIKNASSDTDAAVTVYATVAEKATEAVVNASSLTGTDKAIIDAREATSSSKITTGKNGTTNITLAAGKSEDTLVVGDTTTKKTITVTNFASDDVLSMSGLTLDKTEVSLENDEGAKIVNGKNTVILGSVVTDKKVAKFGLNDKTVYAAVGASATINVTAEDDLSKLYIKGYNTGKDTTLVAGGSVDLTSANIYDIYNVSLTKDAANATLKGFKTDADHGLNLNASAVTDGAVIWANNSSKAIDTITLNTTQNGADTVVVASTDGSDIVNGFQLENDVLYVTDSTAMTFDAGKATIGKAEITFAGTVIKDSEEIMQVQAQKTGKLYHVAGDLDASPEVTLGENANKVDYYAVKKDTTVSLTSAFSDTYSFFKNTVAGYGEAANVVKGGSVTSIDATNATSDSTLMIEGVANVSVGAGTNQVWVHGAAKDGNVQLNSGADTVWFGAEDKNVTVAAYNSESDVINLMGTIGSFTAKADGGKTVITSTAGKGKLSIDTDTIVLVETATNDKYTMKTGTGVGSYDTNTDTKSIYQGYETLYASNVTDDTTIILGYGSNALAAQNNLKSAAIIEKTVKTFDANGATGNFKIVGDASVNNTISGGDGTNYLNGGGASKDTLRGVSSATDNFYWGTTDGNDTLENVGAEDIVQLYDIKLADIDVATTVKNLKSDKAVIVLNSQQKLTINSTIEDGTTFALADATYVIEDGKFVAKQ